MDAVTAAVTSYVATRWYRAPELLTGGLDRCESLLPLVCESLTVQPEGEQLLDKDATIRCIMGELIDQQPLFPGDSDIDQLYRIQLVLGPITGEQLRALSASPRWQRLAGSVTSGFRLLTMEPQGRMTAAEALEHPYLRHFEQSAPHRLIEPPLATSRSPYCGNFVRQQKQALPKAVHRRQVAKALQLEAVVEGHEVALPQRAKALKTQQ
ncbi:hypothetical protein ACSSS7_004383 [Eimeria intestinalis]